MRGVFIQSMVLPFGQSRPIMIAVGAPGMHAALRVHARWRRPAAQMGLAMRPHFQGVRQRDELHVNAGERLQLTAIPREGHDCVLTQRHSPRCQVQEIRRQHALTLQDT